MRPLKRLNVPRLSTAELERLHAAKDWRALWVQALPLVSLAVRKAVSAGHLNPDNVSQDIRQDVALAARKFVESWNPKLGKFSTWIVRNSTLAAMDSAKSNRAGCIGGRRGGTAAALNDEIATCYVDTQVAVETAQVRQQCRAFITKLSGLQNRVMTLVLAGHSYASAAREIGISDDSAERAYRAAVVRLRDLMACRLY